MWLSSMHGPYPWWWFSLILLFLLFLLFLGTSVIIKPKADLKSKKYYRLAGVIFDIVVIAFLILLLREQKIF